MTDIVTVYAIFGSQSEAKAIGRAMIEARLAACVNILAPCTSLFRWEGAIAEESEVPALFKTSRAKADRLVAAIAERHGYEVPAVCIWPIAGAAPGYAEWVDDETDGGA